MKGIIFLIVVAVVAVVGRVVYRRFAGPWLLRRQVGRRVRISYYDHNEHFKRILPRTGTIASRHLTKTENDWYLVQLDEPFAYENREHRHLLIRSKWAGRMIGREKETAVFIVLVPDVSLTEQPHLDLSRFQLAAWGYADVIPVKKKEAARTAA